MYHIHVQRIYTKTFAPTSLLLKKWAKMVLKKHMPAAELTLRIVSTPEMTRLNRHYRGKNKSTNVLSFPNDIPESTTLKMPLLGDIVICSDVVKHEARAQHKRLQAHWAHMVIHGVLHLLGYDHQKKSDADVMEKMEITFLKKLGFNNPYEIEK